MAILNFGSINVDLVYRVQHIPRPGETISSTAFSRGAGGKGLNQSIAIARAGGVVYHLGAVNALDRWIIVETETAGVDTSCILVREAEPTGAAIVMLGADGENAIVLSPGANNGFDITEIFDAIRHMQKGDWLLVQNETNGIEDAVKAAKQHGLNVALSAAPFSPEVIVPLLPQVDLLALNHIEFDQLVEAAGPDGVRHIPTILITHGAQGAEYRTGAVIERVASYNVNVVDTTGAGDTFLGYLLCGLDQRMSVRHALADAAAAAALMVTRHGAVSAIPSAAEVLEFRKLNNPRTEAP